MNESKIDELLDKYFEGETSLGEEKLLKEFYSRPVIPEQYEKYAGHFRFLSLESDEISDIDFYEISFDEINKPKIYKTELINKIGYTITAVAAVAAILIMAYIQYSSIPNKNLRLDYLKYDTYKNPEIAYKETKKTLLYVSEEMNKGMEQLEKLSEFDKSMNELEKISDFNKYQSKFFKGESENEN
ncbi:MAG: hypothetical protein EPN82_12475 [Bacteroidetes bacterium]|nr:MAG: hypothetical protein EPN82_12475 [Bacteroidota bacterium]